MTTYYYKANKKVSLTPEKRERICKEIKSNFCQYFADLEDPKQETVDILAKLFPGYDDTDNKLDKIPSLYEQYKTYTSAIQRACYPSYDAILDVKGLNLESNNVAATYKASLIYDWYNIDLESTLDKCQDDWAIKGEAAAYICWREDVVQIDDEIPVVNIDPQTLLPVQEIIKQKRDITTFRAVDVKRIDPHNLYFDKSQIDNWQHCKKIYRDFIAVENVLANTSYNLTAAEKREIKALVYDSQKQTKNNMFDTKITKDTTTYGTTVEVLEFEGDYVDPETYEVYTNIEATVIAGKYLAKFQESRKPMSSIIWAAYMKRPDTGRGQSPLRIPEILNAVQNMCADLTMRAWKLNTYPTYLAPKGMLPNHVNLEPGQVVEYDASDLSQQGGPQRMDFSQGLRGFDFSDFFQRRMESATGINQYMQGAMDGSVRTASEAGYIHSGATMRMAREAHLFSHNFILKLIKAYAIFKKVFDTQDVEVPIGNDQYAMVTEAVRNGNYKFIIGGSQSAVERDAETQKIFTLLGLPAFQSLSSLFDPVTAASFMKWLLNRMNFQDTNQVLELMDLNGQLRQLANQMGVQPQNFEGFRQDMMDRFQQISPDIAQDMYNRLKQAQLEQQLREQGGQA